MRTIRLTRTGRTLIIAGPTAALAALFALRFWHMRTRTTSAPHGLALTTLYVVSGPYDDGGAAGYDERFELDITTDYRHDGPGVMVHADTRRDNERYDHTRLRRHRRATSTGLAAA